MGQNTILAAGTSAATSTTDVVVTAGSQVTIGIYTTDASGLPGDARVHVYIDTPGQDKFLFALTSNHPVQVLSGPGTFRCAKPASAVAYGAFTET